MNTIKFEVTLVNQYNSVPVTYTAEFIRVGDEGPKALYKELYNGVAGSFGYSGFVNDEAFLANTMVLKQRQHADHEKNTLANIEAQARENKYNAEFKTTVDALFAGDDFRNEYSIKVIVSAVVDYNLDLTSTFANGEKQAKKLLKEAVAEGKRETRENYPEDYRDADEKEDFYGDYADDVSQAIAHYLK